MREKERVRMTQKYIGIFLIPRPHRPQMTRWKHRLMTNLIQVQGKNQPN